MKGLLIYTFLLNCLLASAQFPSISFKNIGINQGLSQSSVVDIAFDANGFVWLATQDGLNRYDGKDFVVYDKKFDDITSGSFSRLGKIVPGNDHSLWIISKSGQLEQLDLVTNIFKPVSVYSGKTRLFITCLLPEENGRLWLGTIDGRLLHFDSKRNLVVREIDFDVAKETPVNAIFKDSRQRLWVLGKEAGYLEGNNIKYDTVYGANNVQSHTSFSSIAEDKLGKIWLGSLGQGLFVKKGTGPFCQFNEDGFELPSTLVVEDILADDEGKIWIGTYGKGLFVMDRQQRKVQQFVYDKKNPFSLAFNDVLRIRQNKNKEVWIGTDGGGVSYYNKQKNNFILFSDQTVPPNIEIAMVRSIATGTNGTIWVGTTNRGLTRIDPKKGQYKTWHFPSYQKNIHNPDRIVSLHVDNGGTVWAGTQGNGLLLFDPQKEKTIKWFHPDAAPSLRMPDATVWSIYPKGKNEVWIGTESGWLCLFDKQKGCLGSYRSPTGKSIANNAVRCITQINDTLLCVAFSKTGIEFFNTVRKKFQRIQSKELEPFFATETNIKSLHYQRPFLWIGTDGRGIVVLNTTNGKCSQITDKEGLPNNTIYGILQDEKGFLWVSTNKGLSSFKPVVRNNGGMQVERFINYTVAQGLQSNEFNTGAYCKALDGTLLFGGISGLNVFDPTSFNEPVHKVPVVFTNVLVDNEPINGDSAAAYKKQVRLAPANSSVAFSFAALNFSSLQQFRYYYKLEGYDKEWINAEQRNYASYTNIPEGQYNFQVKYAKEANGNDALVASMQVAIKGPFWKSWWFMVSVLFLVVGIVYSLYRYRLAQMFQVFKIRQRIASDLHDDIGSALSNINILSELSRKSLHNPSQAQTFLERISEEVQSSGQSLDDIIWSVNLHNDTWPETFSRMRRYASEVFENSNIIYSIHLAEPEGMTKLNMEKRRDIFLIYKELLNNIHKHAAATEVKIDMWFHKQRLVMKLQDNGKGFDKQAPTHRNGLKSLSRRVDRWKGAMNIQSGSEGTVVQITI